jgi:hypothetical protein
MPAVHHFNSSGEAYDATQYQDEVKKGDVLFIWPAGIVGIAHTWPFAVTPEHGHIHQSYASPENYADSLDSEEQTGVYSAGVLLAREIIAETGVLDLTGPLPRWQW